MNDGNTCHKVKPSWHAASNDLRNDGMHVTKSKLSDVQLVMILWMMEIHVTKSKLRDVQLVMISRMMQIHVTKSKLRDAQLVMILWMMKIHVTKSKLNENLYKFNIFRIWISFIQYCWKLFQFLDICESQNFMLFLLLHELYIYW